MKLSEVLKERARLFSEVEDMEVIACNDVYGIALTCTTCNGISDYDIYTLNDLNRPKLLRSFLGSKESAEYNYKLLLSYAKIRYGNNTVGTESDVFINALLLV